MKKQVLGIIIMLLSVLVASSAFAQFTGSSVLLGGTSQQRGENVSRQLVITNSLATTVTGISVSSDAASQYRVGFTNVPSSLAPGASATINVYGYVPLSFDAVDTNGARKAFKIGNILVSGSNQTQAVSSSFDLNMQAEDNLEFSKVTVKINDHTESVDSGDRLDVKPGDKITLTVKVENTFSDRGDCSDDGTNCDFEDVTANARIDDSDFDVDEDLDFGNVDADTTEEDSISFDVPDDVDGTYTLKMEMDSEDGNGATHGDTFNIRFRAERASHEITIEDFNFNPAQLECNEREAQLNVDIKNTGSNDEDRATLDVENTKLDILESIPRIEINQDDTETENFDITLPKNVTPGTYYFDIIAYWDNNDETDRATATLVVRSCPSGQEQQQQNTNNGAQNTTGTPSTVINVIPPVTGEVVSQPDSQQIETTVSKEYVLILGVGVLIVLLLIVLEVTILLRK